MSPGATHAVAPPPASPVPDSAPQQYVSLALLVSHIPLAPCTPPPSGLFQPRPPPPCARFPNARLPSPPPSVGRELRFGPLVLADDMVMDKIFSSKCDTFPPKSCDRTVTLPKLRSRRARFRRGVLLRCNTKSTPVTPASPVISPDLIRCSWSSSHC